MVRIGRVEPAGPTTPRRPWRRWLRRAAIAAIIAVVGIAIGVPVAVATVGPALVVRAVRGSIRGALAVDGARFSWPARVQLTGIALADEHGAVIARIAAIEADLDARSAVFGRPSIAVDIRGPLVELGRDAAGELAIARALSAPDAPGSEAAGAASGSASADGGAGDPLPDIELTVELHGLVATDAATPFVGPVDLSLAWPGGDGPARILLSEPGRDSVEGDLIVRWSRNGRFDPSAVELECRRLAIDRLDLARWGWLVAMAGPVEGARGELTVSLSGRFARGTGEASASVRLKGAACRGPWCGTGELQLPEVVLRARLEVADHRLRGVHATLEAGNVLSVGAELAAANDVPAGPDGPRGAMRGLVVAHVALGSLDELVRPWLPPGVPRLAGALDAVAHVNADLTSVASIQLEGRAHELTLLGDAASSAGPRPLPPFAFEAHAARAAAAQPFALTRVRLVGAGCEVSGRYAPPRPSGPPLGEGALRIDADLAALGRELGDALGLPHATGTIALDIELGRPVPTGQDLRTVLELQAVTLERDAGMLGPWSVSWIQPWAVDPARLDAITFQRGSFVGLGIDALVGGAIEGLAGGAPRAVSLAASGTLDPAALGTAFGEALAIDLSSEPLSFELAARHADDGDRAQLRIEGARIAWAGREPSAAGGVITAPSVELDVARAAGTLALAIERCAVRAGRSSLDATGELAAPSGAGAAPVGTLVVACDLRSADVERATGVTWPLTCDAAAAIATMVLGEAGQRASLRVEARRLRVRDPDALALDDVIELEADVVRASVAQDPRSLAEVMLAIERCDVRARSARLRLRGSASPAALAALGTGGPFPQGTRLALDGAADPRGACLADVARRLGVNLGAGPLDVAVALESRDAGTRASVAIAGPIATPRAAGAPSAPGFALTAAAEGAPAGPSVGWVALRAHEFGARASAAWCDRAVRGAVASLVMAADGDAGDVAPLVGAASGQIAGSVRVAASVVRAGDGSTRADLAVHAPALRIARDGVPMGEDAFRVRVFGSVAPDGRGATLEHMVVGGTVIEAALRGRLTRPDGQLHRLERVSLDASYHPDRLGRWLTALGAKGATLEGSDVQRVSLELSGAFDPADDLLARLCGLDGRASVELATLVAGERRIAGRSRFALTGGRLAGIHAYSVSEGGVRLEQSLDLRRVAGARSTARLAATRMPITRDDLGWLAFFNPLLDLGGSADVPRGGVYGLDLDAAYPAPLSSSMLDRGWDGFDKRPLVGRARLEVAGLSSGSTPLLAALERLTGALGAGPVFDPLSVTIHSERIHYDRALRVGIGPHALYVDGSIGFDRTLDLALVLPMLPAWVARLPLGQLLPTTELRIPLRGVLGAPTELAGTLGSAVADAVSKLADGGALVPDVPDPRDLVPFGR